MSRLPPQPRDNLPTESQQAHDKLVSFADSAFGDKFTYKREDGAMVGPFPFFISAETEAGPDFLNLLGKLGKIPGLSLEARETAILAVGSHYKAVYELYAHSKIAMETTQLSEKQVTGIAKGDKPKDLNEQCKIAYDVAKYLASTPGPLSQELWDQSIAAFGKEGTAALVHFVGFYAYTCIILNAMDAPVPQEGT